MEQRLIDANALMMELMKGTIVSSDLYGIGVMSGIDFATEKLKNTPTVDAVEVVRCKDCEYRLHPTGMCMNPMAMGFDALEPTDSDFCSRGKRRDSDG